MASRFHELIARAWSGADLDSALQSLPVGTLELMRSDNGWQSIGLSDEELVALALRLPGELDDATGMA